MKTQLFVGKTSLFLLYGRENDGAPQRGDAMCRLRDTPAEKEQNSSESYSVREERIPLTRTYYDSRLSQISCIADPHQATSVYLGEERGPRSCFTH